MAEPACHYAEREATGRRAPRHPRQDPLLAGWLRHARYRPGHLQATGQAPAVARPPRPAPPARSTNEIPRYRLTFTLLRWFGSDLGQREAGWGAARSLSACGPHGSGCSAVLPGVGFGDGEAEGLEFGDQFTQAAVVIEPGASRPSGSRAQIRAQNRFLTCDTAHVYDRSVTWRCGSCDQAISDYGLCGGLPKTNATTPRTVRGWPPSSPPGTLNGAQSKPPGVIRRADGVTESSSIHVQAKAEP